MTAVHPTAAAQERPPVSAGFTTLYALAVFGTFLALLTPPVMTLALRVAELAPDRKESVLSLALGLGALISLLVNPVAGLLSDRTTSRWGMRNHAPAPLWRRPTGLILLCVAKVAMQLSRTTRPTPSWRPASWWHSSTPSWPGA